MRRLLISFLLIALLAPFGLADDKAKVDAKEKARQRALKRQAVTSLEIFKKEFKTRNIGKKMKALLDLAKIEHDLIVDHFGKKILADPNPEIRDAAAQLMGDMKFSAEKAGAWLKKWMPKNEDEPEVLRSMVRSIANLGYKDCLAELESAGKRMSEVPYRYVTVEVVRACGTLELVESLPYLLSLFEYGGQGDSWEGGEVTVDTGAAGDVDQRAAEKKYGETYGNQRPKRPPAPVIRTYMQELEKTVKKLTGQTFKTAKEMQVWLEANAKKLGLDLKKLKKKRKKK